MYKGRDILHYEYKKGVSTGSRIVREKDLCLKVSGVSEMLPKRLLTLQEISRWLVTYGMHLRAELPTCIKLATFTICRSVVIMIRAYSTPILFRVYTNYKIIMMIKITMIMKMT